jgi:hypothetical protein
MSIVIVRNAAGFRQVIVTLAGGSGVSNFDTSTLHAEQKMFLTGKTWRRGHEQAEEMRRRLVGNAFPAHSLLQL